MPCKPLFSPMGAANGHAAGRRRHVRTVLWGWRLLPHAGNTVPHDPMKRTSCAYQSLLAHGGKAILTANANPTLVADTSPQTLGRRPPDKQNSCLHMPESPTGICLFAPQSNAERRAAPAKTSSRCPPAAVNAGARTQTLKARADPRNPLVPEIRAPPHAQPRRPCCPSVSKSKPRMRKPKLPRITLLKAYAFKNRASSGPRCPTPRRPPLW